MALGEYLSKIKDSGEYLNYADTWASFLADPEINISKSMAARYSAIYRKYIQELGLDYEKLRGLDTNMLYYVAGKIDKENADEWLEKVRTLSRSDIIREVKHPDANVMECEHEWKLHKEKCHKCGEVK